MPEKRLQHARRELDIAREAINRMQTAQNLDEFENQWRLFLNSLEKSWIKAERECQPYKNSFEPWQGKFKHERRIDPLLRYLKNARDADNHSIEEIVTKEPGGIGLRPPPGITSVHIKHMEVQGGKIVKYEGDPLEVVRIFPKIKAKPFSISGQSFPLPQNHRGSSIRDPQNPIELAQKGIDYYSNFIAQTELKLMK